MMVDMVGKYGKMAPYGTSFSALDVFLSFAHFGFCFLGVI
jgi:hypothetical protein